MKEMTVTAAERGQRFEKYIKRVLPEATTSFVYKMLRKKNITLNDKKADGRELVAEGDVAKFFLSDETFAKFAGESMPGTSLSGELTNESKRRLKDAPQEEHHPGGSHTNTAGTATSRYLAAYRTLQSNYPDLRIVYEGTELLIVNKPAGVLSQKAQPSDQSLNEWFIGYLLSQQQITDKDLLHFVPSVANRLDRNTSGLVLCAKTLQGSRRVTELLRERTLRKFYQMVVAGDLREPGVIEGYLDKDTKLNKVSIYKNQTEGTAYTKTLYRPLAHTKDRSLTLLEAELVTGKTHQLRAHLAAIRHPIVGDVKYGSSAVNLAAAPFGVKSQLLCCVRVVFPEMDGEFQDLSGRTIEIGAPAVFRRIMNR